MRVSTTPTFGAFVGLLLTVGAVGPPPAADSIRDRQWHLDQLQVDAAHKVSQGDSVVVAVIDSGVDASHPDLAGSVLPGIDLTGLTADARQDIGGHGTGMAGIIASHGKALGVAPKAKILPVRVQFQQVPGAPSKIAEGVTQAVGRGADVVCIAMSTEDTPQLRKAVQHALDADIVVVASVGNDSGAEIRFPAAYDGVVAVGGTDKKNEVAEFSNLGRQLSLTAPAVDILSVDLSGGYGSGTGTSDATAIVAGVAALVRSKYPDLSARDVVNRMTATATDKGPPGRDDAYGYGIVDPVAALTADIPPLPAGTGPSAEQSPPRRVWLTPALVGASVLILATIAFLLLRRRRR